MADAAPDFLTTREAAALLRVRERKVYDLAAAGEIPHRRVTGKLLFPRAELLAWMGGDAPAAAAPAARAEAPALLAGSHDPLLDWAARESGSGLATLLDGSGDGLARVADGRAALAGLHLRGAQGWNVEALESAALTGCVLIAWATRRRGLLSAHGRTLRGVADLRGRRVAMRQAGAGAAGLLERLLTDAGLTAADVTPAETTARTESEAAAMVASGEADAALGLEASAKSHGLAFTPLLDERFDLLVDRRAYFTPPVQRLLAFARGEAFARRAAALGGYDVGALGRVRWLSA